ncbi:hypothetical protein SAMN02799636_04315 [Methylobacterium sp. 275MFSha3.1]|uniref:hypothetical protein n=1 Tax=Methylobacterium sp. 275MFSha3.1 TaxID=1502746 RepID=UPI0008A7343D|nr:hypothetical protein [Methylobacterium sp. 275MFSha3.1]SEH89184.1 hypothetical protein SAMN02799636_04315 [Methylobacterium sp. 275MFSha3.1]
MSFDYSTLDAVKPEAVTTIEIPTHGFPTPAEITLATINYYDNGPEIRGKWHGSRYALNWQMFTQTQPFTPSSLLSAWSGATQMHDPDFFARYLEQKGHAEKMGEPCWQFYRSLYDETFAMRDNGCATALPLLGQFISKYPGTTVHYGCVARMWWDEFEELIAEVFLDQTLFATIEVNRVANNAKDPKNLLRGHYDPLKLWRSRNQKKDKNNG